MTTLFEFTSVMNVRDRTCQTFVTCFCPLRHRTTKFVHRLKYQASQAVKYGECGRVSQSRGAESAHKNTPSHCGETGKKDVGALAQSAKCATVPFRHLRQVKNADNKCMLETLISSKLTTGLKCVLLLFT